MSFPRRAGVSIALCALLSSASALGAMTSSAAAAPPNTPSAAQVRSGEWWLSQMGIEKAWSVTKGRGVTVGLLDSGVDPTHPDLQGSLVPGTDVSGKGSSNGEKPVGDDADHGTTMAAFIVGRGHDGAGMLGVAPQAKLMSASFGDSGSSQVSQGLRYLVDHGVKVVNMSFGGTGLKAADIAYAESHDVVLVAATGNGDGGPPDNPSTQFGVVSVSGVVKGLTTIASGASYGPPEIDKGATTTTGFLQGTALAGPYANTNGNDDMVSAMTVADGTYAYTSGTSNAAAIVSGIVALIRAAHPDLDANDVINRLITTASLGKSGQVSPKVGFGVPDAYAAVSSSTVKSVCANPLGSQATKSLGFWPVLLDKSYVYKPTCDSGSSSSPAPSTSASSGGTSAPASAAPSSTTAASSSGSSGGIPAWVWVVVAVAVLAALALVLVLRNRGRRGGPGGPAAPPGGGGYSPPPGGWQQGPPQGGWSGGPS